MEEEEAEEATEVEEAENVMGALLPDLHYRIATGGRMLTDNPKRSGRAEKICLGCVWTDTQHATPPEHGGEERTRTDKQ